MNNKKVQNADVIDLMDCLHNIIKYRKMVLTTTIAGLIVGIILSVVSYMRGEMSKQYVIKTSIAVTSQVQDGKFSTNSSNPNSTDIHLAEDMVDAVIFVIRSDRTLNAAIERLELVGISAKDIYDNLSLTQYKSTQIIDISLYWRNAEEGIRILDAINAVSPQILIDVVKIGGVSVVNDPSSRYLIGGSVNASMWVLMAAAGMAVGMGISVLILFVSPTVFKRKTVCEDLNLQLLGEIPENMQSENGKLLQLDHLEDNLGSDVADAYSETAYILQNLLRSKDKEHSVLFVTSAQEGEGKTSVTANLGLYLSELEKKVLLIDLNVSSPKLGSVFMKKVEYERSLNAVFRGEESIQNGVIPLNGYLSLLPAVLEDGENLMNSYMLDMIRELTPSYDFVLIDTASVGNHADILCLNRIADGAIFVTYYDHTTVKTVQSALERLRNAGVEVYGCILNRNNSKNIIKYK